MLMGQYHYLMHMHLQPQKKTEEESEKYCIDIGQSLSKTDKRHLSTDARNRINTRRFTSKLNMSKVMKHRNNEQVRKTERENNL